MGNSLPAFHKKICLPYNLSKEEQNIINAVKEKEIQFNNAIDQEAM